VIRFGIRGLAGRKLRSVLTALAIVLGVATVSGTYVLTDSISSAFDTIFSSIYVGTDASITGRSAISHDESHQADLPPFDESLLGKVQTLPGVAAAIGGVADDSTNLIGKNGKVISFGFAPHLGFSVDPTQARFNSLTLVDGDWPGAGQVVIDRSTAHKKDIKVGDLLPIEAQGAAKKFRVSGLVKFGSSSLDIGGATLAGFDLRTAQKLFNKPGKLDQIRVARKPGVTEAELLSQIRSILPPATQVRTGTGQAKEDASDTKSFTNFLQTFLLSFGGIALFVGAFVIANSLSITVAQRAREFATLRTIGATRRQILRAVLAEAFVVGLLASIAGLFLGLGLAKLLFWVFRQLDFTLANSGLLLQTRTVVVSLIVGVLVTMVASLRPALRATRVPPISAVREGVTLPPGRFARWRAPGSATLGLIGFALVALGLFAASGTAQVLLLMGVGALCVFVGVAFFSSQLVSPLAHTLGAPAAVVAGAPGLLARENSMRNPQRTASTASALMIGLALVTLVTMLAQGIRHSFYGAVDRIWITDYAVTAENNFDLIPTSVEKPLRQTRGVENVVGVRSGSSRAFGATHSVSGIDRGADKVFRLDWKTGSQAVLNDLGPNGAFVNKDFAKDHRLQVGSTIRLTVPNGKRPVFRLKGIYDPPNGGSHEAAGPVHLPDDRRRREPGEHRAARPRAGRLPEREGPGPRPVQEEPGELPRQHPQHPLRAARPVGDRQPVRDHQHARADRLRADARDRDAARGRDDALAGALDDRAREHRHVADGRCDRDRARDRSRRAVDRPGRLPGAGVADRLARRLRDRRDRRRTRRRDLPGAARGEAERPAGAPVRVAGEGAGRA
jgi:putative ABC transport system permease protein